MDSKNVDESFRYIDDLLNTKLVICEIGLLELDRVFCHFIREERQFELEVQGDSSQYRHVGKGLVCLSKLP